MTIDFPGDSRQGDVVPFRSPAEEKADAAWALKLSAQVESALVGRLLLHPEDWERVDFLRPEHFTDSGCAHVMKRFIECVDAKESPSPIRICQRSQGVLAFDRLMQMVRDATMLIVPEEQARHVYEDWHYRKLAEVVDKARISRDVRQVLDIRGEFDRVMQKLAGQDALRVPIASAMERMMGKINDIMEGRAETGIISTGWHGLDRDMGGYRPGELVICAARPAMGKALPVTAPVLTPDGWRAIGSLKVGDDVVHPSGAIVRVEGVFPQGIKPIFKVTFADGRAAECCDDHLWTVYHRRWGEWRTLPLSAIRAHPDITRVAVPLAAAWHGSRHRGETSIDAYLLGVILGDGHIGPSGVHVTKNDADLIEMVRSALPAGHSLADRGGGTHAIVAGGRGGSQRNEVLDALRKMGLDGARSHTKFVPAAYLDGHFCDRLALLQGLLDTDGTVEASKTIRYSSASERLATEVVYLARSLGASARIRRRKDPHFRSADGERRRGRPHWTVTIRHTQPHTLFRLERKMERLGDGGQHAKRLRLGFRNIAPAGDAECVCIKVAHPDGLFFTSDFTVTHNTIFGLVTARRVAHRGRGVLIHSLEIDELQCSSRMIADEVHERFGRSVKFKDIMQAQLGDEAYGDVFEATNVLKRLPLETDMRAGIGVQEIAASAERWAEECERRRTPMGLLVVDYLGLMRHGNGKGNGYNRAQEIGDTTMALKQIAKDLSITVLTLVQLSRDVEKREVKKPILSDLRDSGSIEQDADVVMFLFREEYYERMAGRPVADNIKNRVEVITSKNRPGETGITPLDCNVACNVFRDPGAL